MRRVITAWLMLLIISGEGLCLDLSPERLIEYANRLAEREEYKAAAEEYYRTLLYFPKKQEDGHLIEAMLKLAEKSEDYRFTLRLANQLTNWNSAEAKCLARYYHGRSLYRMRRYDGALDVLELSFGCSSEVTLKGRYYMGLTHLRMRKWDEASKVFKDIDASFPFLDYRTRALETAHRGSKIRYRSPRTAGALSFLFPGAGYFYSGSPKSGLAALLTVGLLSLGTVSSFQSDNDGVGVVLSILGVGWHFGGVYGSARAARRYNEYLSDQHIGQIEIP